MKKNLRIVIIMILILCSISNFGLASNIEELQEKHDELNTQIENKNEVLNIVQNEISETLQEIQKLTEEISKYEVEIKKLNSEVNELKESVDESEAKLKKAEKSYESQRQLLEERLVAIYEAGEVSYLDLLLNTRSLSDFISTYFYLSEIVQNDTDLLQYLEREKEKIELEKKELALQKEKLKTLRNNKERISIVLENTRVLQNNYKNQLSDAEQQLQLEIEEYERQLKEVEAEITLLTTAELGEDYIGGIMAWPVPGYTRITSEYGMRLHPILNVYKIHTGIDIGAPTGANFITASDGIVIKAGFNSAYGNMVIIDHGGGVSTLYAHGSEILVTIGQEVKRGEPILKVGSTGYSTGPHAHFEVRINGEAVQPLNFLTRKSSENNSENSSQDVN